MRKLLGVVAFCFVVCNGFANAVYPPLSSLFTKPVSIPEGQLLALYQNLDPKILQSEDQDAQEKYLLSFNPLIVEYLNKYYKENLTDYFEMDDAMIFLSGFFIGHFEEFEKLELDLDASVNNPILDCLGEAIGIGKGASNLFQAYKDLIKNGAKWDKVWPFIKSGIKRYVGWIGAGYAIYKFGDCMGWW
jgi:hypothetical protein